VLFVFHGVQRNAEDYFRSWLPWARLHGVLLLVPELSRQEFPGSRRYSQGHVLTRKGRLRRRSRWSLAVPEQIYDALKRENPALGAQEYSLYGHSAGAQFVHRCLLLRPRAPVRLGVAANAGWYCWPKEAIAYPFGLGGTRLSREELNRALGKKLVLLLGQKDVDPDHRFLNRSPEALQQGFHRLARGRGFFAAGRVLAAARLAPFGWSLVEVPGVGHSNRGMREVAGEIILSGMTYQRFPSD
jgi:pimeloyl-ACP methyl ester carboxylesterase